MEVDWSVGQIVDALERNGILDDTLLIFTSDNGPWLNYGNHAGSAGPLREGKQTMFEGGCRVPTIMQWPRTIPAASTCDQLISSIDLLPTIAAIAGADLPEKKIDGMNILSVLKDPQSPSPRTTFFHYFYSGELHAVRDARWKLHFPHHYVTLAGKPGGQDGEQGRYTRRRTELELYDLQNDVGETKNVIAEYPEVVERLKGLATEMRSELGDRLQEKKGAEVRPAGSLADSQ
jgi:arylsulfatase A-like enzyme